MSFGGLEIARKLVCERFPQARAARLGGSTALGIATATSDLDITVLFSGTERIRRPTLRRIPGRESQLITQARRHRRHPTARERRHLSLRANPTPPPVWRIESDRALPDLDQRSGLGPKPIADQRIIVVCAAQVTRRLPISGAGQCRVFAIVCGVGVAGWL